MCLKCASFITDAYFCETRFLTPVIFCLSCLTFFARNHSAQNASPYSSLHCIPYNRSSPIFSLRNSACAVKNSSRVLVNLLHVLLLWRNCRKMQTHILPVYFLPTIVGFNILHNEYLGLSIRIPAWCSSLFRNISEQHPEIRIGSNTPGLCLL